jgi:hypothetical protein
MATFRHALSLALALLAPAAAAVTIDFDDFEPGTVTNEYETSGVRFIGSFGVTDSNFGGAVTAPSPPNIVQIARPAVQTVRFVIPANPTGRATTGSVSVDTPALSGGCYDAIDMDAFSADGILLDTTQIPAASPTTPKVTTTLTVAGIHEIRFTVIGNQCIAPIDNLVFDPVVPVSMIFSDSFESPP